MGDIIAVNVEPSQNVVADNYDTVIKAPKFFG